MKKFYKKINIPNLDIIQQELISTIEHDFINKKETHSWIGNPKEVLSKCPTLSSFLNPLLKKPLGQIKFYCTPAWQLLEPHVDGSGKVKIPFGLNIPLMNTKDTYQVWYYCPPSNTTKREIPNKNSLYTTGYLSSVDVPANQLSMPIIENLELDVPAVTKTDVMHSVFNPTNKTRLVAVFRWGLSNIDYSEIEDVLNIGDLIVDQSRDFC
jgi:hypothetical protein